MAQVRALYSSDPGPRFQQCVDEAQAVLRAAADRWALGQPEDPPTTEVLEAILFIFEHQHFLGRGFAKV
jgi:hypothetical protein